MKDIRQEVDKFLENFSSSLNVDKLRNAVAFNISQEGKVDLKTIKEAEEYLNNWFERKLYSLGRIVEGFETIARKIDYQSQLGIGYSVEAKKDKINIGRYLLHLLLIIESKDREIGYLKNEVKETKGTYIDMENMISDLINDQNTPSEIKDKFNQFYWLRKEE
jgi:hypothetical protein